MLNIKEDIKDRAKSKFFQDDYEVDDISGKKRDEILDENDTSIKFVKKNDVSKLSFYSEDSDQDKSHSNQSNRSKTDVLDESGPINTGQHFQSNQSNFSNQSHRSDKSDKRTAKIQQKNKRSLFCKDDDMEMQNSGNITARSKISGISAKKKLFKTDSIITPRKGKKSAREHETEFGPNSSRLVSPRDNMNSSRISELSEVSEVSHSQNSIWGNRIDSKNNTRKSNSISEKEMILSNRMSKKSHKDEDEEVLETKNDKEKGKTNIFKMPANFLKGKKKNKRSNKRSKIRLNNTEMSNNYINENDTEAKNSKLTI